MSQRSTSSTNSAQGRLTTASKCVAIYFAFSFFLLLDTLLSVNNNKAPPSKNSTIPRVRWSDVPKLDPAEPEPMREAKKPLQSFCDDDLKQDNQLFSMDTVNAHPSHCKQLLRDGTKSIHLPKSCQYITHGHIDQHGHHQHQSVSPNPHATASISKPAL